MHIIMDSAKRQKMQINVGQSSKYKKGQLAQIPTLTIFEKYITNLIPSH
jgi:hypothetical protein